MTSVALVGCTGMVVCIQLYQPQQLEQLEQLQLNSLLTPHQGSRILTTLLNHHSINQVDVLARRNPHTANPQAKLTAFVDTDTSKWSPHLKSLVPIPTIFFSSLATTRAAAGGFENQYKLEHDVNLELAKAAKEAGTKVYVLISSGGADKASNFPYLRLKGEIEEDVKELGFETTVILRPGVITGHREESRPAEAVMRFVADFMGKIHSKLKDMWAHDADVIARASVKAGLLALEGKAPEGSDKVWELGGNEILRLGRTEWNDGA